MCVALFITKTYYLNNDRIFAENIELTLHRKGAKNHRQI